MPAPAQTSTAAIVTAARRLLEGRGLDALTMRDIAAEVGVRGPSLYKRVRNRSEVLRLVLEDVSDELAEVLDSVATSGDPAEDVRAMAGAYRTFAHAHPGAYALLFVPGRVDGAAARARRSSASLLRAVEALAGPEAALPAARTVTAWAHGFIMMEMSAAFHLGGDVEAAWEFGIRRIVTALGGSADR